MGGDCDKKNDYASVGRSFYPAVLRTHKDFWVYSCGNDYKDNETVTMKTVTVPEFNKQFLSDDAQTLIKAGYLDPYTLEVTHKGNIFLNRQQFEANKTAMLAAAQSEIAAEDPAPTVVGGPNSQNTAA